MNASSTTPHTSAAFALSRDCAGYCRKWVLSLLSELKLGRLYLELPEGTVLEFGQDNHEKPSSMPSGISTVAKIRVIRETLFRKCILSGDIGLAESYMDGDWESPDLTAVISWFILNHENTPTLSGSRGKTGRTWKINLLKFANRLQHLLKPNSKAQAKANIEAHYDLSNDFFSLFLDPSMMYSSALWPENQNELSLERAQWEKNDALCQKLQLGPNDHVLEIGTGWGGWAIQAVRNYGCKVTSLTLSQQQLEYATRKIRETGLEDRIDVQLRDYRDVSEPYDKIVSIEMMEAIGHKFLPEFGKTLARALKPNGLIALQFITCPDHRYKEMRKGVDFIQKHIFPGSLLISLNRFNHLLSRSGGFILNRLHDMGCDYARTLKLWRESFHQNSHEITQLGFDTRFLRKWDYYFSYCEAAFAMRNISVVQTLYTRPNNLDF